MPPFRRTDIYKAAEAMELVKEGKSTYQAATLTDLPQRTIHDIVAGKHNWKAIHNDPLFREHRLQIKRSQQVAMNELIGKSLCTIDAKLPQASALQAATVAGILFDKERLLAGEATQHISVVERKEITDNERAIASLMVSMGMDAEKIMGYSPSPIDVTPIDSPINTTITKSNTLNSGMPMYSRAVDQPEGPSETNDERSEEGSSVG